MKSITEEYLTYNSLFLVDEEHYAELQGYLKKVMFKKASFFLRKGEYCRYLGFMKGGVMRSFYHQNNGREINVNFYHENGLVTDYDSILPGVQSEINIKAVEDSELFLLDREHLQSPYHKDPYWQEFGRKITETAYLRAKKRIEGLLCLSPEQRYHQLLEENPKILQLLPQKHIASYLGIQPESLSRIRRRIQGR